MTSDLTGSELLGAWRYARALGMTQVQHAASLDMKYSTYVSRMNTARAKEFSAPVSESRYEKLDGALELEGDWLIMGDAHIPYHHAGFVNRCIAVAQRRGVKNLLLGGDAIDNEAVSKWPEEIDLRRSSVSAEAERRLLDLSAKMSRRDREALLEEIAKMSRPPHDLSEEMANAREVFRQIGGSFDRIVTIMGNHESRITRALEKSMSSDDIMALFGARGEKWETSPYYYCDILSGSEPVHVTHPYNAGKGSSKKIVSQYNSHVVMLHNHHFSVQSDPSGKWLAIEPGMCGDPERMSFESLRDRSTDKHVVGAVLVQDGHFTLLNQWADFDMLLA